MLFINFLTAFLIALRPVESAPSCQQACTQLSEALPGAVNFGADARSNLWSLFQAQNSPQCRVQPSNAQEVAQILSIVRAHQCHFAVLAGGTSPFRHVSNADGGITIDMHRMKDVKLIDSDLLHVRAGAGSLWADVYKELDPRNMSATGTRNSLTGVTGSILGGGISFFSQKHGWACDTVVEFEVVLANSSIINVTHSSHPDLFFALRGGGNNFGVVTSVTIEAFRGPPTWYTFQLWDMKILGTIFKRLQDHTIRMPDGVWQIATTLGWHVPTQAFVISERMVASELPELPEKLPVLDPEGNTEMSPVVKTFSYQRSTLAMSQKMDMMNMPGFYNYFGSVTVKNSAEVHMAIGRIFQDEVQAISNASDLQIYIVYNPLTIETIQKMQQRGGNALGIDVEDGPLTIININLHWSEAMDTPRMTDFMRRLISRFRKTAQEMGMLHRYLFQNHSFEEQDVFSGYGEANLRRLRKIMKEVDPEGVFQKLQPGYFKLGEDLKENTIDRSEL